MVNNKIKKIFFLAALGILMSLSAASVCIAEKFEPPTLNNLQNLGAYSGYKIDGVNSSSLSASIGDIIAVLLSMLGVVFIILFIYAGYNWMTAAGEEDKVNKAKDTMQRAILGLIVLVSAYAIWAFIWGKIL